MSARHSFFATTPKGMEPLLAGELRALGAEEVSEVRAGVSFAGTLETALTACLWSRTASRVLLPLARFPAPSPEALYEGVKAVVWEEHLSPTGTLAAVTRQPARPAARSHVQPLRSAPTLLFLHATRFSTAAPRKMASYG